MSKTKIEWTDRTWNPATGCSKVSQGCKNCYAETFANRKMGEWGKPFTEHRPDGVIINRGRKFTDVICHPDRLEQPLHWRKPSMVFVNSMSDLFHEDIPFEFIDKVFAVMHKAENHIFQILTKRPQRALEYILTAMHDEECNYSGFYDELDKLGIPDATPMPNNIWLGVSVEDQATADERIPLLLQIPAAVRFLSCEPLLGEVDLSHILPKGSDMTINCLQGKVNDGLDVLRDKYISLPEIELNKLHWVICGGESASGGGHGARPMELSWAEKLMQDCKSAGVPFFMKQICIKGKKIDFNDFTDNLKVRQMPE